jgi:hypothetical protein
VRQPSTCRSHSRWRSLILPIMLGFATNEVTLIGLMGIETEGWGSGALTLER